MNANYRSYSNNRPLDNDALRAIAPSIFAENAWEKMSDRYTFIPTIQVVEKMRSEGFVPYAAKQAGTRIEGRENFTLHTIRFRHASVAPLATLGQLFPEIVLTNSHDGKSGYRIDAGLLRLACLNGLMVSDSTVNHINARHTGNPDGVLEAAFEVVEQFPKVIESAENFGRLQLSAPEQNLFAETALSLRYDDGAAPVSAQQVLRPRRVEDNNPSLWATFNRVQESLVQSGGVRGFNQSTRRRVTTRPVEGITENAKLNKALWSLAEKMAELKAAA